MWDLKDLKIVVTGASRGIGLTVANGLQKNGAKVLGIGRSKRPSELDVEIQYLRGDLLDLNFLSKLHENISENFGEFHSLVNIAGVSYSKKEFDEIERFVKTIQMNLETPFRLILSLLPLITKNGLGTIINFSSINSQLGFPGNPGYVASKSGISGLTRSLAIDLAHLNIRVNGILPGYFPTDMTRASFEVLDLHKKRSDRTILNRWGNLDELVAPVAFLCSSASSYITGHDLPVDGGWLVQGLR